MLKTQENFIEFLQSTREIIVSTATQTAPRMDSFARDFNEKTSLCEEKIAQARLLIPVTGAFSAGKSSLLNGFLKNHYLPTAITPETALATELHFGSDERIEAVTLSGEIEMHEIGSIREISERASEIEYLRAYMNSPVLESINPLVLVDMPGFNSPLDAHNKAILGFIDRGSHYVVLVSVEDGGLTTQTLRQLQNILDNGRSFSLFLSKTDLRTPNQVKEIADHISGQMQVNLGLSQEEARVNLVDLSSAQEKLENIVNEIRPEQLVRNLFSPQMKELFFSMDGDINTLLATLGKDEKRIRESRSELNTALVDLEEERDRQIKKIRESSANAQHVQSVLNGVKKSLEEFTESLTQTAMFSQEALQQQINDLVLNALTSGLRQAQSRLSEETTSELVNALKGKIRADMNLSPDMVASLIDRIKDPLLSAVTAKVAPNTSTKTVTEGLSAAMGPATGMMALVAGVQPWIAVTLTVVPGLVDWLLGAYKENRKREQITLALRSQIFPGIMLQLRPAVESFLRKSAENAVKNIASEYEQHLDRHRAILADAEKEKEHNIGKIEADKELIRKMQQFIQEKANTIIFAD